MEKKGLDTVDNRRKERRDNSERKADQAEGKDQNEGGDAPAPKNRRKRATGEENGWMSMNKEGTGSRHAAAAEAVAAEEEEPRESHATSANRDKHLQDDNDEIVLIPDLDEEGGADSDQRIAHAPRNVNRKIPTLKDLENEVKAAVPTSEEGLNLSVLLSTLVPAAMVKEDDVVWTFESLLREVTDELSNTPKTVLEVIIPPASNPNSGKAGTMVTFNPNGGDGEGAGSPEKDRASMAKAGGSKGTKASRSGEGGGKASKK